MNRTAELYNKRQMPVLCKLCNKIVTRGNIVSHEKSGKHINEILKKTSQKVITCL